VRFAGPQHDPAFAARPGLPRPVLRQELALTPQAFNLKFKGSPVKRAKRRGYLRNVAVALGNAKDSAAVPDLARLLLEEPEALIRQHAAWALGQIGGDAARQALLQSRAQDQDEQVRQEVEAALRLLE
jgi:epoxyqueuosine reductase